MNPTGSLFMMPFEVLYGAVTRARLAAYRKGLFSVSNLPAPVISIGNITTGGTGKTPLVEWVCRVLASELPSGANKVCVLTRGYGRANPDTQVVVSDGSQILADERQAGDEPFLLAQHLLGVAAVIANADRIAAGQWAIEKLGTHAFVLDDGFQHLRIGRDLNIVTIDATNPWGDGTLLPHGRLRESVYGLSRSDCIVITRAEQVEDLKKLKNSIREFASAPILISRMITTSVRTIKGANVDIGTLLGMPLAAFCGVGNPSSFFTHLERDNCNVVFAQSFPDHHVYRQADIDGVIHRANQAGATALLTTAKDAVKLASLNIGMECLVLEIEISVDEADQLKQLIRTAVAQARARQAEKPPDAGG